MTNKPIDNSHIKPLTGIRFVAALSVFFFHYNPLMHANRDGILYGLVNHLNIGVTIFFVLSGFLICFRYYEQQTTRFVFLKAYLIKRFARIYPLFIILTTILYFVIAEKYSPNAWWVEYFLNITLLKGFSEKYYLTGIAQAWSLTVEETFYLGAPLILYLIRYKGLLFSQIIFISLIGVLLVLFFDSFPFQHFFKDMNFMFIATFFGRCFEFFAGIVLALLYMKMLRKDLNYVKWYLNYTLAGAFLILLNLFILEQISNHFKVQHATMVWQGILVANFFLPVCISVFFFGLIIEKSFIRKVLSTQAVMLLGKSSYSFYLISAGFIAYTIERYVTTNIFALLILLLILSVVFYFFVERFLYRYLVAHLLGKSTSQSPLFSTTN